MRKFIIAEALKQSGRTVGKVDGLDTAESSLIFILRKSMIIKVSKLNLDESTSKVSIFVIIVEVSVVV